MLCAAGVKSGESARVGGFDGVGISADQSDIGMGVQRSSNRAAVGQGQFDVMQQRLGFGIRRRFHKEIAVHAAGFHDGTDWSTDLVAGTEHDIIAIRRGATSYGATSYGPASRGTVRHGAINCGTISFGSIRRGIVSYSITNYGDIRHGVTRQHHGHRHQFAARSLIFTASDHPAHSITITHSPGW
ncbi:hypothetical protein [Bifidobacterium myosotis]|uniref:Uncharacterized protein n=1 Tax=Bifidobacterium myosotis TaxID=1630166 RepID=A0A5M9ZQ94_9BIFI|nr:hypothetical protein [Bifidobacterium myosotis]KAA8829678.1 hypothetical protein EMO91_01470 [Bifidobacterium myosotis]